MRTLSRALTIALRIGGYLAWLATWKLGFRRADAGLPARHFAALLEGLGFGEAYRRYAVGTPAFLPSWRHLAA